MYVTYSYTWHDSFIHVIIVVMIWVIFDVSDEICHEPWIISWHVTNLTWNKYQSYEWHFRWDFFHESWLTSRVEPNLTCNKHHLYSDSSDMSGKMCHELWHASLWHDSRDTTHAICTFSCTFSKVCLIFTGYFRQQSHNQCLLCGKRPALSRNLIFAHSPAHSHKSALQSRFSKVGSLKP